MWNYNFIFPSLIILIVFVFFYFSQRRIPIRLNKFFLGILQVEMFTILFDCIACKCLDYNSEFSLFFLTLINTLFFVMFLLRGFYFFIFTTEILKLKFSRSKALTAISTIIFLASELLVIINLIHPFIFSVNKNGYTRAAFYNAIYINSFYLSVISVIITIYHRKKLSRKEYINTLLFNILLVIGYIVRILFSNYLIMDIFCLIAIICIYLTFENPDLYLDEKTGLFNSTALNALFAEMSNEKNPFILGFIIHNYTELREIYTGAQMDKSIKVIANYLTKTYPNLLSFYIRDGRYVLVGKNIANGVKIRKEISKRFSEPWTLEDETKIFFDIGFVKFSNKMQVDNADKFLLLLQTAMASVEKIDSNTVMITEETMKATDRNTAIKRAVERAVENNDVELYLQPLIDVNDFKIIGAEALARIKDFDNNIIPPVEFIPIAEKNGRIDLLGQQVFEKTCKFIQDYDIKKMGLSWINVNLSPIQFLHKDLNSRFSDILRKYSVPANMIHLEITEESMIDYALLQKQIHIMKHSGFQFVLDDYGSGYSNVTRLKKCPFINVKLDMEIVWDYFKTKDKILPTLVETFKQMNFSVTAEGIESIEMAEALKEIGCDYLQGFYFSKPIPAEEFAKKYGETK
ncbi:MAG: EAL domain-containing protein [Treponema sp.]|nr:EAL domain-containing protein [Treponema sp.]